MKSEVFNGSRFWNYFKYDLVQMWRNHMKAAIGIGLSGVIIYFLVVLFNLVFSGAWCGPNVGIRVATFVFAGAALEFYYTRIYGYLTDRRKGSAWLMIPASAFEKWLSMMIMALIVLPIVLIVVFLSLDWFMAVIDPTVGNSLLYYVHHGYNAFSDALVEVNAEYETFWTPETFVPVMLASFCFNYLFFLICGICFKKNKILNAILVIILFSIVWSIIMNQFGAPTYYSFENFSEAQGFIEKTLDTMTLITSILAAGIAGGIFYRIKTIKH